jgi:uracil-DNA glycosylase family protein
MPPSEHVDVRELIPESPDLDELREIARGCTGCDLYKSGTQTVFGEGAGKADVMLVGEQPGDQEDKQGHPFVGPAGRLLDEALGDAGLKERSLYVTNVVKHFKWVPRGKRRIHKKPNLREIRACRPWLDAEIEVVGPRAIVCLGATAAQALLGSAFRVTEHRGEMLDSDLAPVVAATIHPSAILRGEPAERERELAAFTLDLAAVAGALDHL